MSADRATGDFGSRLREARELRGITLRQIANTTKITVSALEALEKNDLARLPGGIFSRAFVRSYALEVGLDPEETIQQFIAQFPTNEAVTAGHPTSEQFEDKEAHESDRRMASTFLRLIALSIPIALAVLYFSSLRRPAAPEAGESPASAAQGTSPSPTGSGAVSPDAAAPTTPPVAAPTPAPSATAPAASGEPAGTAPGGLAVAAAPASLTIGLSAARPCWVSATADGQKIIERLLQPGEKQEIEVKREFVITAGDAAAILLTLNGAPARALGKTGEVVTARLNLANFRSYLPAR